MDAQYQSQSSRRAASSRISFTAAPLFMFHVFMFQLPSAYRLLASTAISQNRRGDPREIAGWPWGRFGRAFLDTQKSQPNQTQPLTGSFPVPSEFFLTPAFSCFMSSCFSVHSHHRDDSMPLQGPCGDAQGRAGDDWGTFGGPTGDAPHAISCHFKITTEAPTITYKNAEFPRRILAPLPTATLYLAAPISEDTTPTHERPQNHRHPPPPPRRPNP